MTNQNAKPAHPTGWDLLAKIAAVAEAVAWQAGVGAAETAGMIVSHLYEDPRLIERFMAEGTELLIDGTISPGGGRLSFYGADGVVRTPEELALLTEAHSQPVQKVTEMTDVGKLVPGGIRRSDHLHVETNDGTCSRCRRKLALVEMPLMLWLRDGEDMYVFCERCLGKKP